jgi:hypothetical protein
MFWAGLGCGFAVMAIISKQLIQDRIGHLFTSGQLTRSYREIRNYLRYLLLQT